MTSTWREYQQEACDFFHKLGWDAATDVAVQGVRTSHDIDVLVNIDHAGFKITWVVECKAWRRPVTKLHVMGLREIVHDIGADRGILLAESGFQSGALEASNFTNVQVTSLKALKVSTKDEVNSSGLKNLLGKLEKASYEYWEIPKEERINHKLRSGGPGQYYPGIAVIQLSRDFLGQALRGVFPIQVGGAAQMFAGIASLPTKFETVEEVIHYMTPLIDDFELRISDVYSRLDGARGL
ncbi:MULTISPECIES: restriction endonuclease [Asticcacaulis]|uniref:restriction endonuclease n=1 Tax=Asticcacaulis TaxID=76890 RepID=UPI001AE1EDAF|nr:MULTISPECIES: restriction endonuclease [Asticcacaulis]MBP2159568.1 hypothetical protein [Asticcacaulis solisilvae]MDR6800605.1 hypothetical protein [Asticcacaulis sp. BE141]